MDLKRKKLENTTQARCPLRRLHASLGAAVTAVDVFVETPLLPMTSALDGPLCPITRPPQRQATLETHQLLTVAANRLASASSPSADRRSLHLARQNVCG